MVASSFERETAPSALAENSTVGPYLPETLRPALSEASSLMTVFVSRVIYEIVLGENKAPDALKNA